MLTRDLLRVRTQGVYLKPQFVSAMDHDSVELAQELISIYSEGMGETAGSLDEAANACVMRRRDLKLARGIMKIVRDRAVFSGENDDFPYAESRAALFERTARLLRSSSLPEQALLVRDAITSGTPFAERGVYNDLPENEELVKFRRTFPKEAVERYNIALVQGVLLQAESMDLEIPADNAANELRALFRAMRFFRLLFTGLLEKGKLKLHIDGPVSVLENSTKYGFQMACFFPAVCRLSIWKITAAIARDDRKFRLLLDNGDNLRSHWAGVAVQPEEHRMFAELFQRQVSRWTLDDAPGFLTVDAQKVIFPDFAFRDAAGKTQYLELFHRWHAAQLEDRLQWCENTPGTALLLGVDRALLKKDGILKNRLESSPYFQKHGCFFRDFPGVDNTVQLLERNNPADLWHLY